MCCLCELQTRICSPNWCCIHRTCKATTCIRLQSRLRLGQGGPKDAENCSPPGRLQNGHTTQKYTENLSAARTNSMCPCVQRRKGTAAKIKLEDSERILLFPNIGLWKILVSCYGSRGITLILVWNFCLNIPTGNPSREARLCTYHNTDITFLYEIICRNCGSLTMAGQQTTETWQNFPFVTNLPTTTLPVF